MSRILMTVAVLGLAANMAFAVNAGFDILGTDPIEVPEGGSVEVLVAATAGQAGGMALYMQAIGGFEITAIDGADFAGGYWQIPATATYEQVDLYPIGTMNNTSYGVVTVGAPSNVNLLGGETLARVTISANGLLAGATGTLTTDSDVNPSDLAFTPAPQDTVGLVVTPEPATALLLLGALPLIRRRRA